MKPTILIFLLCMSQGLAAQDTDIEANERSALEEIFRSSDQAGEIPVNSRQRRQKNKRMSAPAGSFRIGCICMDDSYSKTRSTGACSGRGGVRFWLYRTQEGDTVRVLTGRHERHPHALNAAEMSALAQKRQTKIQRLDSSRLPVAPLPVPYQSGPLLYAPPATMPVPADPFGWPEAFAYSAMSAAAYFTVRMILRWIDKNPSLVRYALRNLLRSGKRSPSRKNGKTPPKTRV